MKTVLLVDLSILMHASWHASVDGPVSGALDATLSGVRRCVGEFPDALVAVCLDSKTNWRKKLAPETYKAQREKLPASFHAIFDKVKQRLRDDGMWLVEAEDFESDDIVATLATQASKAGHPIVIASSDKDLLSLLALPDSQMLRTHDWSTWRAANVVEKFGVEPESMPDMLALIGDKSDGVAGVPSVGPVTAKQLLIAHGDLDGIYLKVDALQVFDKNGTPQVVTMTPDAKAIATPAIVDKLWRHKADAYLARKLVELRTDAPVKFEDIFQERKPVTKNNSKTVDLDSVDDVIVGPPKAPIQEVAPPKSNGASEPVASVVADVPLAPPPSSAPAAATETALVVAQGVTYERALEPRTMGQALTFGEVLYESRAFSRFPSPGAITATMARGRELGIPAMASLDAFHFAAEMGRILPSWQLIHSLAERDPKCKYFRWVKGDEKSATWETWHADHPEPTRMTYTIEQAQRAGLIKENKPLAAWNARPEEQLSKTCCCILARRVYSGAVLGLIPAEEIGEVAA